MEKSANSILKTTIEKVRDLVDVSTIIGEPITLPDGITIIDFKSDYVDNKDILIDRYTPQINAYRLAIESLFKGKIYLRILWEYSAVY